MATVVAVITQSVDGYIVGPDDGPGAGLGTGGERLHYWVFGGPWTYDSEKPEQTAGVDKEYLDDMYSGIGAVITGRWTYEAAGHWGDATPWGVPVFVVTHRPEEEPPGGGFTFVNGVTDAVEQAAAAAGDKKVHVMGGAQVIRQALDAGLVDELSLVTSPVILGSGKRLFEGFTTSVDLEQRGVRQSQWATFVDYAVKR